MSLFEKIFGKKIAEIITPAQSKADKEYNSLLMECISEVEEKNKVLQDKYGFGNYERWDLDQEVGRLEFSNGGKIEATCEIVILGSFSNVSESWMWGWANESLLDHLTDETLKIKKFGEVNGIKDLTDPKTMATESEAWALGSYGCRILDGIGIYRGPTGNGFVLMMIKTIQKNQS